MSLAAYPSLHKFFRSPYIYLVFGVFFLGLGVLSTLTGEALTRGGRVVNRDNKRKYLKKGN